jgi:hypothetical protein
VNQQPYDRNNWYDRNGVARPQHDAHLTEDEIQKAFDKLRAETVHGNWIQVGNRLTCQKCNPPHTSEPIPTNYLLQGTDDKGLPILKKLDI